MSYCRWGEESDVYAYRSGAGYETHVGPDTYVDQTPQEFLTRLLTFREHGQKVPQFAINRVKYEIQQGDEGLSYGCYLAAHGESYALAGQELTPASIARLKELREAMDRYLQAVDSMS